MYGLLARKRYGPPKERIDTDPAYAVQKRNYSIFGEVSKACGLIRKGFEPVIRYAADSLINTRLMTPGRAIYKSGMQFSVDHPFHTSAVQQLKGFRLNKNTGIHQVFDGKIEVKVDNGYMTVILPGGEMKEVYGASHYRIGCSVCSFDFAKQEYSSADAGSEILLPKTAAGHRFEFTLPVVFPVHVVVIGVVFYTYVNGDYHRLNNHTHAAADVVEVVVR